MGNADRGDRGDGRGEPLQAQLLLDPKTLRNDLKMIEKAVEERWPISPRKLKGIIERLYHIVETEQVVIPVKDGVFDSVLEANKVAVTAARVLVAIEGQNQADRHLLIKAEMAEDKPAKAGDTYNIGVLGSISHGGEPVSINQARTQAVETVSKLLTRIQDKT